MGPTVQGWCGGERQSVAADRREDRRQLEALPHRPDAGTAKARDQRLAETRPLAYPLRPQREALLSGQALMLLPARRQAQ